MTIEELIAKGRAELEAAQLEETRRDAEEARQNEELRQARVVLFMDDVRAAVDPVLHPYLSLPEYADPAENSRATFSIPGCTPVHVMFYIRHNMEHYKPYDGKMVYIVARPIWDNYDGLEWRDAEFSNLSYALVAARQYKHDLDDMTKREEMRKAEAERQMREQEEQEERQAKVNYEKREAQDRERQDLVDLLANDLVAFHLLRAFYEIQAEREAWRTDLASANQAIDEIADIHARRVEAVEKRAQAAQRDAEDARARETEARNDADRAERKLKQAQRGW